MLVGCNAEIGEAHSPADFWDADRCHSNIQPGGAGLSAIARGNHGLPRPALGNYVYKNGADGHSRFYTEASLDFGLGETLGIMLGLAPAAETGKTKNLNLRDNTIFFEKYGDGQELYRAPDENIEGYGSTQLAPGGKVGILIDFE